MQFPPFIETDDQLRTYDARNIKITTYQHSESSTLGDDELRIEKFEAESHGGDIEFAYNLPLYETPYQGFDYTDLSTRDVSVDGKSYTAGT